MSQIPGNSALLSLLAVATTVFSLGLALRFLGRFSGWLRLAGFAVYGVVVVVASTVMAMVFSSQMPGVADGVRMTGLDVADMAGLVVCLVMSVLAGPLSGSAIALLALPVDMYHHVGSGACASYLAMCSTGVLVGGFYRRYFRVVAVPVPGERALCSARHVLFLGALVTLLVGTVAAGHCMVASPSVPVPSAALEVMSVAVVSGLLTMGVLVFVIRELHPSCVQGSALDPAFSPVADLVVHRTALENRVREHSRALEEVENRYSALVDLCPDSLLVHVGGSIVFANEVAARLLGYPDVGSLVGLPFMKLVPDDLSERVSARTRLAMRGHPLPYVEERLVCHGGSVVDVEVGGRPVTFCGARAVQLVIRDISSRRRAEVALREGSERWRILFENVPDPIVILDLDTGRVEAVNANARTFFGNVFRSTPDTVDVSWDLASFLCGIVHETEGTRTRVNRVLPRAGGAAMPSDLCITRFQCSGRRKALVLVRDPDPVDPLLWDDAPGFRGMVLPARVCS